MRLQALAAALLTGVAAGGLLTLPAEAAPAALPAVAITRCGQSIDRDAYLTRNLTCSSEFGILVAQVDFDGPVPNVKIDLRGHTLRGPGPVGSAQDHIGVAGFGYPGPGVGIDIRNGRVQDWGIGLASEGPLTVTKLWISGNQTGVHCNCVGLVTHSAITHNQLGATSIEGSLKLRDDRISGNAVGSSVGYLASGDFSHNHYSKNTVAAQVGWLGSVLLQQNSFIRNGTGVTALGADDTGEYGQAVLEQNLFLANRDGVYLPEMTEKYANHRLSRNVALHNQRYGFFAPGSTDLGGNVAVGNGERCVGVVCAGPRR